MVEPTLGAIFAGNKSLFREIVFAVFELFFASAETEFEAAQTLVRNGCSAKVKLRKPIGGAAFDGFPHDKIIRPQVLRGRVRSTEFINCLGTEMEDKRCREWDFVQASNGNESVTGGQNE